MLNSIHSFHALSFYAHLNYSLTWYDSCIQCHQIWCHNTNIPFLCVWWTCDKQDAFSFWMFFHTMSKEYHLQCPCYVPVMSLLGWVSVFWDLNSLPHIFQTKSQIIIANFCSFSYFDPIQASVCLILDWLQSCVLKLSLFWWPEQPIKCQAS